MGTSAAVCDIYIQYIYSIYIYIYIYIYRGISKKMNIMEKVFIFGNLIKKANFLIF